MCGFIAAKRVSLTSKGQMVQSFSSLKKRGPDKTIISEKDKYILGFHRLAIMDPSKKGDQPFYAEDYSLVCNGEIFNHKKIAKTLTEVKFRSHSDCEVILPLFFKEGLEQTCKILDGEFAFVIWDPKKERLLAGRDPIGIRPLFYGYDENKEIMFASEMKALVALCKEIKAFPPGCYFDGFSFHSYIDLCKVEGKSCSDEDLALKGIHDLLVDGVEKRLEADVPVGFLLSGGLDSSLVCAIAQRKLKKPIDTFAIGMKEDSIDLKYAREVAEFIGSNHHECIITKDMLLEALEEVVYTLESWDITTVRASLGMYLLCKFIRKESTIEVLLTGEVSDELFGYKYTDFAPSPEAFQKEAEKRIKELYMYDVLRADRCISAHGLEARVPFADKAFVKFVMALDPKMKVNTTGVGKYLLRKAFEGGKYLPESILYREKAAFSDGVGHSLVDSIKAYSDLKYSDKDLELAKEEYSHGTPFSKESLLYRDLFEKYYKGLSSLIVDYWMPNKEWENCDVKDPSARALPNYGKSGE